MGTDMEMDRRESLKRLRSALILSATSSILPASALAAAPVRVKGPVALLAPLTGPSAALGLSMRRAATLVQTDQGREPDLVVLDTGGAPTQAANAARQAIRRGARMILGPLFTAEVRPVLDQVAGKIPVLSFSNNSALRDSGAFVMGITPNQLTASILQYARSRGVRTVAMFAEADEWGQQSTISARALQGMLGIDVITLATAPMSPEMLRAASGGTLPDALFLAGGSATVVAVARALRGSGVQLLGTIRGIDYAPAASTAMEGAWFASPDPAAFADFANSYETKHGGAPGAIAALAYDGATVARTLRETGAIDRTALLASGGFQCVTGKLQFRSDGSCARELSILVADAGGYSVVGKSVSA